MRPSSPGLDRYTEEEYSCSPSHCEASLREEVEGIPGVEVVAVDRASGRLLVRGESLDDGPIRDAVAAAGYRLVTAPSGTASGEE